MVLVLQESWTSTPFINVPSFSTVASTLFSTRQLRCLTGIATISISRCFLFVWVFFVFTSTFFFVHGQSLLSSLCILLLIGFLKFWLFLQIGVQVFEYSAFWNPLIPIFIPTTVKYKVFHLFVLYGSFYTPCFIKKRSPWKHSTRSFSWNLGLGPCLVPFICIQYHLLLPPPRLLSLTLHPTQLHQTGHHQLYTLGGTTCLHQNTPQCHLLRSLQIPDVTNWNLIDRTRGLLQNFERTCIYHPVFVTAVVFIS